MSYLFNGNVNVLNEVEVKNDTGNPLPVEVVNTDPIQVEISNTDPITTNFTATAQDAFGRLRVSTPYTLFDSQHRYTQNDKWSQSTSGGGGVTFDANASLVNMNVGTASGDQVIRESKKVMAYQPGKSLLIYSTFQFAAAKTNLRQRCGYFGANNGIYFQVDDNTVSFVLRSYSGGSLQEDIQTKDQWNVDSLDGTGPSGYNISTFDKSIIFFIDIEWLGVGDVRCGFILNGEYVLCHVFKHTPASANPIDGTYMTTACLPVRLEITNKAITASSSTLKSICNSVLSEAGYDLFSRSYHANLGVATKNLTDSGTDYPLISLRLNSSYLDSIIILKSISLVLTSNAVMLYKVLLNGTLSGANWVNHECLSVDVDTTATTVSGGSPIIAGYIDKAGGAQLGSTSDFNYQLGRTLAGVSDVITLVATPKTNNSDVLADLGWYKIV